jgi:hypothetical protein
MTNTSEKINIFAMEQFNKRYPELVVKLSVFKKKMEDWNAQSEDTRGPNPSDEFDLLCKEAEIPLHSETVHPALPYTEWKLKSIIVDSPDDTATEKNVVYKVPDVMYLNVVGMA